MQYRFDFEIDRIIKKLKKEFSASERIKIVLSASELKLASK